MDCRQVGTKVVIENRTLRGSRNDAFLQRVATVYIDGDEYRVLAPPKATGSALEWLDHLSVRKPEGCGSEIIVNDAYSVLVIKVVKEELEKLQRDAAIQMSPASSAKETANTSRRRSGFVSEPPTGKSKAHWTRGQKIALSGVCITLLACVAAWLVVPEFRRILHLDKPTMEQHNNTVGSSSVAGTFVIAGTVVDASTNSTIGQARISIVGRSETSVAEDNGNFRLELYADLPREGVVRLHVAKDGYLPSDQTTTPTNTLIIQLRKK
jgi:hypothetical protein